jgi:hypothetical protein
MRRRYSYSPSKKYVDTGSTIKYRYDHGRKGGNSRPGYSMEVELVVGYVESKVEIIVSKYATRK